MPRAPQTGATEKVWSRWPWVSSTAAGCSRCSASTASSWSSTPMPGSTTTHCSPGAGGDHVAVGAEGVRGKAGDEHRRCPFRRDCRPASSLTGVPSDFRVRPTRPAGTVTSPISAARDGWTSYTTFPAASRTLWRACGAAHVTPGRADTGRRRRPGRGRGARVASSRDRQRKLARAKLDRQMARRAAARGAAADPGRRRRRTDPRADRGGLGLGARGVRRDAERHGRRGHCPGSRRTPTGNTNLKDVGSRPTSGLPTDGTRAMTVTTDQGAPIVVELDLANAPCAAASMPTWRAGRSTTTPSATRSPPRARCAAVTPAAPASAARRTRSTTRTCRPCRHGATRGQPGPRPAAERTRRARWRWSPTRRAANGSQFLIFFKDFTTDDPKYPIIGRVTGGPGRGGEDRRVADRGQ